MTVKPIPDGCHYIATHKDDLTPDEITRRAEAANDNPSNEELS